MQHSLAGPGHQTEMYRIDGGMIYEVNTALIRLNNEPESFIRLSNQASRLLYMLVSHAGVEMERADLIHRVWEKHGFSGSSVSLNVSISEIRKAFRELGHDPGLISTLRKKGFCLQALVERLRSDNEFALTQETRPVALTDLDIAGMPENDGAPVTPTAPARFTRGKAAWLALLLAILCLLVFLITQMQAHERDASSDVIDARPVLVGTYNQCSLYTLTADEPHSNDYLLLIQQRLDKEQIDCHRNKADVYFTRTTKHLYDNTFMGVCYLQPDEGLYRRCVSYRRLEDLHDDVP